MRKPSVYIQKIIFGKEEELHSAIKAEDTDKQEILQDEIRHLFSAMKKMWLNEAGD